MAMTPQHTYQLLTKRPERMRAYMTDELTPWRIHSQRVHDHFVPGYYPGRAKWAGGNGAVEFRPGTLDTAQVAWPLRNVGLGVTAGLQRTADRFVPLLLETPAAWHFLSAEPLLGPLDLTGDCWGIDDDPLGIEREANGYFSPRAKALGPGGLDWVIVGGESAGPERRRLVERCPHAVILGGGECAACHGSGWHPKHQALERVRSIRDQCVSAGVPFFFKQWGGPLPKSGGRVLDGTTWSEYPLVAEGR